MVPEAGIRIRVLSRVVCRNVFANERVEEEGGERERESERDICSNSKRKGLLQTNTKGIGM